MNRTLSSATILDQSGPVNDSNEEELHIFYIVLTLRKMNLIILPPAWGK